MRLRPDLGLIADWIPQGAHVLDLGCGNGELLRWLAREKACTGYGVEINHQAVQAAWPTASMWCRPTWMRA